MLYHILNDKKHTCRTYYCPTDVLNMRYLLPMFRPGSRVKTPRPDQFVLVMPLKISVMQCKEIYIYKQMPIGLSIELMNYQ